MFTNSHSSNMFMQNLQSGKFDRHCMVLAVLETIVFSALTIAFSCGMIACSTASTPCTGVSCQNTADGGASGSDGATSDDAGNDDETGNKAEASDKADIMQVPDFKNSVNPVCDFKNNIPPGLECMKCTYDKNQNFHGCGYKDLNSPAGNKCTKNPWILNAPGEWKVVVLLDADPNSTVSCGYDKKPSCNVPSHRFVVACRVDESYDIFTGFTACPDGFLFKGGLGWSIGHDHCLLENGTTFSNQGSPKASPYGEEYNKKGKLWWKDGNLYAGFCRWGDFVDVSREHPCNDPDGKESWEEYVIIQKISN